MLYSVFGLIIESEFEIPGLLPTTDNKVDVCVRFGDVPDTLDEITGEGAVYQLNATQFRIDVNNVARYFVEDGRNITVQPYDESDVSSVQVFLLGTGFGALLHQRGMLPLHASSIVRDSGAIVFCGHSGAGKSTIAAALLKRGYTLLADDISVLAMDDEKDLVVVPGIAQQKLWADTLKQLGETDHQYNRLRPQFEKYAVPILDRFHNRPLPVQQVFILTVRNKADIKIEPIRGVGKITQLTPYIFRQRYMRQMGHRPNHAGVFAQLAAHVEMFHVQRPSEGFQLVELIEQLQKVLPV